MDLKTDLLPSLKKISLYYKISPPSSLSWPRPLLLYKIYCNFSDDYKIHPCMMYYYCCYCYNDYEQKNKVCVLVFCEKKWNYSKTKNWRRKKKLKITTRFQYLFLSDEEEYFSAMTAHKKHWKIVYLFCCCLCRPFSILDDTSLPDKTRHPQTHTHTNYTYNVYTHRLKKEF